jgi:myo-inositol-1(or 4)-monophosphatase
MENKLLEILAVAKQAASCGAKVIVANRSQHSEKEVRFKAARDLVTDTDQAAEEIIVEVVRKEFPGHVLLTEEQYNQYDDALLTEEHLWVIDPLDGTMNFAHEHPHVGVSIAYASKGIVQVGVVFSPFHDELFYAIKGSGAFCNDKKIFPRFVSDISHALVATGFPPSRPDPHLLASRVEKVITHCRDLRRIGAASLDLCWVACGRLDAYYESIRPWDLAAGGLIAREAGAKAGRLSDKTYRSEDLIGDDILYATPEIFAELKKILLTD